MSEDTIHQRPDTAASQRDLLPVRQTASAGFANSLPKSFTTFVGRVDDLVKIQNLLMLDDVRLLTLTGPGGVGKTRLALEVSARMTHFADGFHFVDLASVRDPALVAITILRSLGGVARPDRTTQEDLSAWLEQAHMLLVLDNFEHILEAAPLTGMLAASCPGVKVLVTSRTRLRISGEHVYSVLPLMVPKSGAARAAVQTDAERLFVERARQTGATWTHSTTIETAIGDICRLLDGLPLAIELAAAWSPILPPAALLSRLSDRFDLLRRGPRDGPARHRTLIDAVAWSQDLLRPEDQVLMRRLSVFVGGFTIEAAEAVAGEGLDLIAGLLSLVDASLLTMTDHEGRLPRYAFLETIREYALTQLAAQDEEQALRKRHADYYVHVAERWWDGASHRDFDAVFERLQYDHGNIRTALGWAAEHEPETAMRLAGGLDEYWSRLGHVVEGRQWLDHCLKNIDTTSKETRVRTMMASGWLALQQVDLPAAEALLVNAADLCRSMDSDYLLVAAMSRLGAVLFAAGKLEEAKSIHHEELRLSEKVGNPVWIAVATMNQGRMFALRGDLDRAETLLQDALGKHQQSTGAYGEAVAYFFLGGVARARGKRGLAAGRYRKALTAFAMAGDWANVARSLEGLAGVAGTDEAESGARLLGATATIRQRLAHPVDHEDLSTFEQTVGQVKTVLLQERFQDAWDAGAAMSWEQAVAEGVRLADSLIDRPRQQEPLENVYKLSPREMEVLQHLVNGDTDAEIATALYLSRRTVTTHVRHIYDKLGISSRAEAAAKAVRLGLA